LVGEWIVKRIIDGTETNEYTLPRDFSIEAGQKIKVSAILVTKFIIKKH